MLEILRAGSELSVSRVEIARWLRDSAELQLHAADVVAEEVAQAAHVVIQAIRGGRKVLLFGNGGSAADAQHLAAEFVGRFARERRPFPAIALTTDTSALTAIANDYGFDQVFARQVAALGQPGDVVIAISASGNSPNVLMGVQVARQMGMITIGLTGEGGKLARMADASIIVPSCNVAHVQECHIAIGHALCEVVESALSES